MLVLQDVCLNGANQIGLLQMLEVIIYLFIFLPSCFLTSLISEINPLCHHLFFLFL